MGTLLLHASSPELDGQVLHAGDSIELWIFGSWISGTLICDHTGWSLLTAKHVRIRPSQGLLARLHSPCLHAGDGDFRGSVQEGEDA
jgi:hypothetical protein